MKIAYDKEVDALNVTLREGKVAETREISPEILLDLDRHGNPLYLEIIGASEKIGQKDQKFTKIGHLDRCFDQILQFLELVVPSVVLR